jgi:hypothetical protein
VRAVEDDVAVLVLAHDGRLVDPAALERLAARVPGSSDCFVLCLGWADALDDARRRAARWTSLLDGALRPARDRVARLHAAVHWPSVPLDVEAPRQLLPGLGDVIRREPGRARALLSALAEAEVPAGPEDELALDHLRRALRDPGPLLAGAHALAAWVMRRRAGEVGERLARDYLLPLFPPPADPGDARSAAGGPGAARGDPAQRAASSPRLHLVGHSFGASLLTAAVLAGLRPASLTLLQGVASAFAFAEHVPGTGRAGSRRRLLAGAFVDGPIAVVHSVHDRALQRLHPAGARRGGLVRQPDLVAPMLETVARSALGAMGARGAGATDLELTEALRVGVPWRPLVNVDGSRRIRAGEWLLGAHRDVLHPEIAALVALAARLTQPGAAGGSSAAARSHAAGPRPRPVTPLRLT